MLGVWACLWAGGCAGTTPPDAFVIPPDAPKTVLTARLFEPGPSEDRFESQDGPVVRVRTAPDESGVWTTTTRGPSETSVLTLQSSHDGAVRLLSLVSGDRDVVCDPGLVLEPGTGQVPHAAEGPCTIDGRAGTARVMLEPLVPPEATGPGEAWVRMTLRFSAAPIVAERRFDWRAKPGVGILEERAVLEVTFFGATVRSRSRTMNRTP